MEHIAKDHYELLIADQIDRIKALPHYQSLFHPAYANNFSIVLANRRIDLAESKETVSTAMRRLNVANFNLYRLCEFLVEQDTMVLQSRKETVQCFLDRWNKLIVAGNSFLCFDFAQVVIKELEFAGIPIIKTLNEPKYVAVINEFKSLSYKFKSFFKLSVFQGDEDLYKCIAALFEAFSENSQLFYYLERCEVAKEYFPSDINLKNARFPVLSVFFDKTVVTSRKNPLLEDAAKIIRDIFPGAEQPDSMMYLDSLGTGITISQGYKSYKKFLNLIQVIDEVYDAKTNYAYINQ